MATHKQKQFDEQAAREEVDRWNARYRVGQVVEYSPHTEVPVRTLKTTSEAFVLNGNTPCVSLETLPRAVALVFCRPVEATAAFDFAKALGAEPLTAARARLRDRIPPLVIELDLARQRMRALLAIVEQGRPLTEFALERGQLVRELEALAQQVADLHVSSNPQEETS